MRSEGRILICTPSNAAIDEIMRRLVKAVHCLPKTGTTWNYIWHYFLNCLMLLLDGCLKADKRIEIVRVGEGYSKDVEKYTIGHRSTQITEQKITSNTLKAEVMN